MNIALENAGIVRRGLACAIDLILVPLVSVLVMLVSGVMEHAAAYADNQPWIRGIGLGVAGYLILNGWLLYARGQTFGKLVTGLAIVAAGDGSKPELWRLILVRGPFFALLYLPIIYPVVGLLAVWPLIDLGFAFRADRRSLHDLVAGTRVVRRVSVTTGE